MTGGEIMAAVRLDETGPPENLRLVEVSVPDVPPDGVLIRADYAGVIYADAEARRGTYYRKTVLPWFPGREVAGTVERVGSEVESIRPGDVVCALVFAGGCYAQKVLARTVAHDGYPPCDIVRLSPGTDAGAALVYLVNYRLAHMLVHGWARVPAGARIAVHGASGGMGSMVLELAAGLGCETIALVRSDREAQFCKGLGAATCIDTTRTDYVEAVCEVTSGKGVDFSFNGVGGTTINRDPGILAPFGELHLYGYVAGKQPFDPFAHDQTMVLKTFNADNFLRTPMFAMAHDAMMARFAQGNLLAPGLILPMAEVAEGHRRLEAGEILGKLLLRP